MNSGGGVGMQPTGGMGMGQSSASRMGEALNDPRVYVPQQSSGGGQSFANSLGGMMGGGWGAPRQPQQVAPFTPPPQYGRGGGCP